MAHSDLRCDGCGQAASPEHIARRLQRLEWSTRYRPVHIGTLLLGAVAPQGDFDFLYSPSGAWTGEAKTLLSVAGIATEGRSAEATLAEFQRAGLFLTHVLGCPVEDGEAQNFSQLIGNRLPSVLTRIRRSLKPKRLAAISGTLQEFLSALQTGVSPCALLLDEEKPFRLDGDVPFEAVARLRAAIAALTTQATAV